VNYIITRHDKDTGDSSHTDLFVHEDTTEGNLLFTPNRDKAKVFMNQESAMGFKAFPIDQLNRLEVILK
jgi:hypothetical protein